MWLGFHGAYYEKSDFGTESWLFQDCMMQTMSLRKRYSILKISAVGEMDRASLPILSLLTMIEVSPQFWTLYRRS